MSSYSSEPKIDFRKLRQSNYNHQQIVYGDSKFIFYDCDTSNITLKRRTSNAQIKHPNKPATKVAYSMSRPQTGVSRGMHRFSRKPSNTQDSSVKENTLITLKFNQTEGKQSSIRHVASEQNPLSTPRVSRLSNMISARGTSKNKTEFPYLNITQSKDNLCVNRILRKSCFDNSRNKSECKAQQEKQVKTNSQSSNNEIKRQENKVQTVDQSHQTQMRIVVIAQNAQTQKVNNQNNEKEESISEFNHNAVKNLFGNLHMCMRPSSDYLIALTPPAQSIQQAQQLHLIKEHHGWNAGTFKRLDDEQNQLKGQLIVMNDSQIKPSCLQLESDIKVNKASELRNSRQPVENNSFSNYVSLERAPLLSYLKNSQTKKLFPLITQQMPSVGHNYIDKEFSHEQIYKVDGKPIQWIYIKPTPDSLLFSKQIKSKDFDQQINTNKQELSFVQFLRCLYYFQPNLIQRLFEPNSINVYSVWLFVQGSFQPIFIDGYFPLDQRLNHLYGGSQQHLWLVILIKCICKVTQSFSREILSKIQPSQIYKLLTGYDCEVISKKMVHDSSFQKLRQTISRQIQQGSTFVIESADGACKVIMKNSKNLISYSPIFNQISPLHQEVRKGFQLLIIPLFLSYFVYNFKINENSLNKFELICHKSTELCLSIGSNIGNYQQIGNKNIYVYECDNFGKSGNKIKLVLKEEGQLKSNFKLKLKRGCYKIFVEDGEKKIHLLFSDKKVVKWSQKSQNSKQFNLSILTNHEIKLSDIERLEKKENVLQDSEWIYKNSIHSFDQ